MIRTSTQRSFIANWTARIGQWPFRIGYSNRAIERGIGMKAINWQLVSFVAISLLKEYWCYAGLPRVYYWQAADDDKKTA